ncbi:Frizzled-1 [Larimichthys crocea]|uniref:Frizzled-1 n=1 Tax=Larimichthys crocea TaxID=215358 RepID=A0A6G0IDE2_LARCR|nr:Frizzled-1 [Larimichthys crocea]
MCRVVVPECGSDDDSRMKPCRALCEKVKTDCESPFRTKRLYWPTRLRCESLPESNCVQSQESPVTPTVPATCQQITVPLCQDMSYTETVMPNIETSTSMQNACEQARSGCGSLMSKFGFPWPEALKCEAFTTESCERVPDFSVAATARPTCQPITIPLCRDLRYTETVMPNFQGHATQEEAGLELSQFFPLIEVKCSPYLKPFLCSVYVPECVSGTPRRPCRTLCEHARSKCGPLLTEFGFPWPNSLRCETFTTESCDHYGVGSSGGICEPITIPGCQGLSYNQTIVPNLLGHTSQREAGVKMSFFNSIVQTVCSVDIRLFVCMVYAPQCLAGEVQRPCRSFCEKAKSGCEHLMTRFGVSWPSELQCNSFPEEMCVSEDSRPEMLNAVGLLARLNAGGYSVRGKSLSLKTAHLLLTLMDADKTGDLDVVEVFKLEHYVAAARREYVESYESMNPPSVTQTQMKRLCLLESKGGIGYDEFMRVLTKLQILRDRFKAHLLSLPCDCQVASFSLKQFMKSAII